MKRPVHVELPTGDVVWVHAETSGPTDVAITGPLTLDAEQLRSTVRGVAETLRSALEDLIPDEVQVEFGLELAVKTGKVTSILAEAGGKATIKLTLTWSDGNAATIVSAPRQTDDDE